MAGRSLAAVVMAGGLGTRMRSATPKHLHPILGRRMVDWVLEAARPLGPEPLVVIASPESRDAFGDTAVAVQEQALGTGDAVRSRPGGGGRQRRERPRPLRRHAAAHGRAARVALRRASSRERGARPCSRSCPTTSAPTAASSAGAEGTVEAIVEAGDATAEQLEIQECNSSIYVFRADLLWPALDRLEPHNAQGELYLTDAVRDLVARGERVVAYVAADRGRDGGRQHPGRARSRRGHAPRPDQPRAHARGRGDRRSRRRPGSSRR